MKVTKASDYAIQALVYLGYKSNQGYVMRSEISEKCGIPSFFLGKILQNLARNNILVSEKGQKGGFRLAMPPNEITFLDVICALEEDISIIDCIETDNHNLCFALQIWKNIQSDIKNILKKITIEDLMIKK